MKTIKGIIIDESENLAYNLEKLREELMGKFSFWGLYEKGIASYEESEKEKKAGRIFRIVYFIVLIPNFLYSLIRRNKIEKMIINAEEELIRYYELPKIKIKQLRLKCSKERKMYEEKLAIIDQELSEQNLHLKTAKVDDTTKSRIKLLISKFQEKREKKMEKIEFYKNYENRLMEIEKKIMIKKSVESSRKKLERLKEGMEEERRHKEIARDFELYEFYGELLEDISDNLKTVEQDQQDEMEALELKEIL